MKKEEFDKKGVQLLELQLAIETYELNLDQANEYMDIVTTKLNDYRKHRDSRTNEENIKIIDELIIDFNKYIDFIGRDHFIFYEDGNINYKWRDIKYKKE